MNHPYSTDPALLRQCIASGQVEADEIVRHEQAGDLADRGYEGPEHWAAKPAQFALAFVAFVLLALAAGGAGVIVTLLQS